MESQIIEICGKPFDIRSEKGEDFTKYCLWDISEPKMRMINLAHTRIFDGYFPLVVGRTLVWIRNNI